ncbi:Rap guanine nucleotide exchange factor 6 [Liparis tanakae]|uniref:Rap guanine nucleotide exchange factor 6 n=1 Tax=Liparis tanakae TaxID=230148 RepID=A0A4Z2EAL2_9TELE|nr:Rap guanine nucleotide exchange factor 6 [Liparis tanakae]
MDENEEYFQRQASHRQSRRRFRKINQKGERQTIIDTVDPYPTGKPPIDRGYHTLASACVSACPGEKAPVVPRGTARSV